MSIFQRGLQRPESDEFASFTDDDKARALAVAITTRDLPAVRGAIQIGADVNRINASNASALSLAMALGDQPIIDALLAAGADVNRPEPTCGMTPLHMAVVSGNEPLVRRLLAAGANVNAKFGEGEPSRTALSIAIRKDMDSIALALLDAGADPNAPMDQPGDADDQRGMTALLLAITDGKMEMVDVLIRHGADVNRGKSDGVTPIVCATFLKNLPALRKLVDAGASLRSGLDCVSVVELAEQLGDPAIVEFLRAATAASARPEQE